MPGIATRTFLLMIAWLSILPLSACDTRQSSALNELEPAANAEQALNWRDELELASPPDLNPDPDILELKLGARVEFLEIVPGLETPAWTYNGSLPAPLIRAKLGDKVIVHFKNSLPEATSIHWHGLRLPNNMDGAPGITQPPIEPSESFTYEFIARDTGTFWYHPRINSAAQVGYGLYGPLVVEDPSDPKRVRRRCRAAAFGHEPG